MTFAPGYAEATVEATSESVEVLMAGHFDRLHMLRDETHRMFQRDHYIEIAPFAPRALQCSAHTEVLGLIENHARRRNITVPATGNTPRLQHNVNRDEIARYGKLIPTIYRSSAVLGLLSHLAGEPIVPVPYPPEEFVVSCLSERGDTHGWHWDDYTLGLIWIIEAPSPVDGGHLEFIANTGWDKSNPRVDEYLRTLPVERRHPLQESAYVLKTDTSMHRVAPITSSDVRRMIVCFAYATLSDLERDISHETMEQLYSSDGNTSIS